MVLATEVDIRASMSDMSGMTRLDRGLCIVVEYEAVFIPHLTSCVNSNIHHADSS